MTDRSAPSESELPEVVRRYQDAHDRRDTESALWRHSPTTPRSVTTDRSTAATTNSEPGCPSRPRRIPTPARSSPRIPSTPNTWIVVNRLEGDFPGGVVDLRYRFVLSGDRISSLSIVP